MNWFNEIKKWYYKNEIKNIYRVEYIVKSYLLNENWYINIKINKLNLQYYKKTMIRYNSKYFYRYSEYITDYNIIDFEYIDKRTDKCIIKFIEITPQLQLLLYSEDDLNRSLGTQIIFQKLNINYE